MPASARIGIAGIDFLLHCDGASSFSEPLPGYRSFAGPSDARPGSTRVDLEFRVGDRPDLRQMHPVFDGESWRLHRDGKRLVFSLAPYRAGEAPVWAACMEEDFLKGVVYCDAALLRKEGSASVLTNPFPHRLDQLLVMYLLATRSGAVIHSAGLLCRGHGYLFAGRSGGGKSTIARLWDAYPGDGLQPLSDDRMIVKRSDNRLLACGTPWAGDAGIALNASAPLQAVYLLNHGRENRAERLPEREALEKVLPMVSVPWYDREYIMKITSFCETLVREVPFYDLHFAPDFRVVEFLEKEWQAA